MFQSNDNSSRQRKGMWQKLKEKKAVEREHESNFKAGRIPIHERNLHRTGIRGRKRYIYYAFLYLLGILCFINLVVRYFTYRNTKMYWIANLPVQQRKAQRLFHENEAL